MNHSTNISANIAANSAINSTLQRAWNFRLHRDIGNAFFHVGLFKKTISELDGAAQEDAADRDRAAVDVDKQLNWISFLSLEASIERFQGNQKGFSERIQEIKESYGDFGQGNVYFLYELGFLDFNAGNYTGALEKWSVAIGSDPRDDDIRIALEVNCALAFDHLGFNASTAIATAEKSLSNASDSSLSRIALRQLQGLRYHQCFRQGSIEKIFAGESLEPQTDQTSLYARWVLSLPYISLGQDFDRGAGELQFGQYAGLQNFRMRTLAGVTHPDDKDVVSIFEHVDRAYLWIWRWLKDPESCNIQKVTELVAQIFSHIQRNALTLEDEFLLRNCVWWLGLFSQLSAGSVRERCRHLGLKPLPGASLLEIEHLTVQWLFALKENRESDAADTLALLKKHELWKSEYIMFSDIVDQVNGAVKQNSLLSGLCEDLRAFCLDLPALSRAKKARFEVNLTAYTVKDYETGEKVQSETIAKSLDLFSRSSDVDAQYFLSHVFGYLSYSPEIHNPKIFSTLSKLRKIFSGAFRFSFRSGGIHASGPLDAICSVSSLPAHRRINHGGVFERTELRSKALSGISSFNKRQAALNRGDQFTRKQLESLMGISRASTNRLLQKLQESVYVEKKGKGKLCHYKALKDIHFDQSGCLVQ